MSDDDLGYVVSVLFQADGPEQAAQKARLFARLLHLSEPGIEADMTTVALEGARAQLTSVFCGIRIEGDERCMQPPRHPGDHCPDWAIF